MPAQASGEGGFSPHGLSKAHRRVFFLGRDKVQSILCRALALEKRRAQSQRLRPRPQHRGPRTGVPNTYRFRHLFGDLFATKWIPLIPSPFHAADLLSPCAHASVAVQAGLAGAQSSPASSRMSQFELTREPRHAKWDPMWDDAIFRVVKTAILEGRKLHPEELPQVLTALRAIKAIVAR